MSQLSSLLGAREPMFTVFWTSSEKRTGKRGLEAKTLGDLNKNQAALIADLGLDPEKVTGEELYQALNSRFLADAPKIATDLNLGIPAMLPKIDWPIVFRGFMQNKSIEANFRIGELRKEIHELAKKYPELEFWNKHFLSAKGFEGIPVSANIFDVAYNAVRRIPFYARENCHFQHALFAHLAQELYGK